jgi:uncharacterized protein
VIAVVDDRDADGLCRAVTSYRLPRAGFRLPFSLLASSRDSRVRASTSRDDAILIPLNAPPGDGAVNDALIAFLSDVLDVPRRSISIVSGEASRDKRCSWTGSLVVRLWRSCWGQ